MEILKEIEKNSQKSNKINKIEKDVFSIVFDEMHSDFLKKVYRELYKNNSTRNIFKHINVREYEIDTRLNSIKKP